jgi:Na+/H+ antiporter NhaC
MELSVYYALTPAFVAVASIVIFRNVIAGLLFATLAGVLVSFFSLGVPFLESFKKLLTSVAADTTKLKLSLFVVVMGVFLELLRVGGQQKTIARFVENRIVTKRGLRCSCSASGFLMFFDDYASILVSSTTFRQPFVRAGMTKQMLAYIGDVIADVVSIVPLSTWAAFEIGLIMGATNQDWQGASVHFWNSIPFHFYTIIAASLVVQVAVTGRWMGAWFENPREEVQSEDLTEQDSLPNKNIAAALFPFLFFLSFVVLGMFVGGVISSDKLPTDFSTLVKMLGASPTLDILIIGVILSSLLTAWLNIGSVPSRKILAHSFLGMKTMFPVVAVILLASCLGAVSHWLDTSNHLAALIQEILPPQFFPLSIFVLAFATSIATGFSWSSMILVLPPAIALAQRFLPALPFQEHAIPIAIGAAISGAVAGSQIIPYSEKSVMAASISQISPLAHSKTQAPQVIMGIFGVATAYVLLGFHVHPILAGILALMASQIATFYASRKRLG